MWTRSELKERGKNAFLRNYWWCVLAALILMLIAGRGGSSGGSDNQNHNQNIWRMENCRMRYLMIRSSAIP